MLTTSLKLSPDLKQRAAAAATRRGVTPHAFMIAAIEQAASAAEQREAFVASAEAARRELLENGQGYDADEVHAYLRDRIVAKNPARPQERSWKGACRT